jgi:16S rRNA (cytosine1402-N4)-methyltransferase
MSSVSRMRAYTQPLDQQDREPLLHLPRPMYPGRNPGAVLAEGLRMSPHIQPEPKPWRRAGNGATQQSTASAIESTFEHRPVMLAEVVELFAAVPEGTLLDATVGAGGHGRALLESSPNRKVIGLDRDAEAVGAATLVLASFGTRATVVKARFDHLGEVLAQLGDPPLSGVLFDLGVSSPQLDHPARGFSYRFDAPLDMRMDRSEGVTAAEFINLSSQEELARLFVVHGEARFARRIAAAIVSARPVLTTSALAEVVSAAVPAAVRRRGHPAKRIFQALRAAVNSELEVLPVAIDAAIDHLSPGGRIVVIAYHSGEDRSVKDRFVNAATGGCTCPPGLPCVCGAVPKVRLLNRGARKPSDAEVSSNPRAQSARLRAAEALALDGAPLETSLVEGKRTE